MKKKILFASIIAFAGIFVSCNNEPEDDSVTVEGCLKRMLQYFPYETNVSLEFATEGNRERFVMTPRATNGSDSCVHVESEETSPGALDFGWDDRTSVNFDVTEDIPSGNRISCTVCTLDSGRSVILDWHGEIRMEKKYGYLASTRDNIPIEQLYSLFTDTITLPFVLVHEYGGQQQDASEGAYMRIVKHQGLVDFSLDGKTVWERVK